MEKLIIASTRHSAGKTGVIVGMLKATGKKFGYAKPFGDRLIYREKHTWDYDTAVIHGIFSLKDNPEETTIGFQHSKLKYMYDENSTAAKVQEIVEKAGQDRELVVVEAGEDFSYGASIHLDALSLVKYTGGKLILVVSGNEDSIVDDIYFFKKHVNTDHINMAGVIINKVPDIEDFKDSYLSSLTELEVKVLGILPYRKDLLHYSVQYLADNLVAKVLAGEKGLKNKVKNIVVGAMSADDAIRGPLFKKENKVIITGGDRSDMILAALETDSAAVVLTNNIYPPSNIISIASNKNIPLLLVSGDTYHVANQVDNLEPLLTKDDSEKIELLKTLAQTHLKLSEIL
jgi:uncharacterized protein